MTTLSQIGDTDPIIFVIGSTGVGKSTFINYATKRHAHGVGHDLRSCTSKIEIVKMERLTRARERVYFVDTPGFDNTYQTNIEIMTLITQFFIDAYNHGLNLRAILYLHRITDNRINESPRKDLELFVHLCGDIAVPPIVIVTTMWSTISGELGSRREAELETVFGNRMVKHRLHFERFGDSFESVQHIINATKRLQAVVLPPDGFNPMDASSTNTQRMKKAILSNIGSDDLIVIVMGPTGVGKSTLINHAINGNASGIGHNLQSYTGNIEVAKAKWSASENQRIYFIDTPGFDDTYNADIDILTMIAQLFIEAHQRRLNIRAILYLHEIADNRMAGSTRTNLEVFANLLGSISMPRVVLVTTKWSLISKDVGLGREKELKAVYWEPMIAKGCRVERFEDSFESAWRIVNATLRILEPMLTFDEFLGRYESLKATGTGTSLSRQRRKSSRKRKSRTWKGKQKPRLGTKVSLRRRDCGVGC